VKAIQDDFSREAPIPKKQATHQVQERPQVQAQQAEIVNLTMPNMNDVK